MCAVTRWTNSSQIAFDQRFGERRKVSERWPSGRRRWTGIPVTSSRVFQGSNPCLSAINMKGPNGAFCVYGLSRDENVRRICREPIRTAISWRKCAPAGKQLFRFPSYPSLSVRPEPRRRALEHSGSFLGRNPLENARRLRREARRALEGAAAQVDGKAHTPASPPGVFDSKQTSCLHRI